jgi:exopolysaccharide biosynthesis predicted pyruvyltransferase EpsI
MIKHRKVKINNDVIETGQGGVITSFEFEGRRRPSASQLVSSQIALGIVVLAFSLGGCMLWIFGRNSLQKKCHRPCPWDSQPPHPISPFPVNDHPVLQRRHACIARIQEHQILSLRPYVGKKTSTKLPTSQRLLLVDPAYHENVGDHMITVAQHQVLLRLGWNVKAYTKYNSLLRNSADSEYQECHYIQAGEYVPHCEDVIHDKSTQDQQQQQQQQIAIWHGGGNWGDLWPGVQKIRIEQSFRDLREANYSVFGMPQSLYYRDKETEVYDAKLLQYALQQDIGRAASIPVVLSWREYESYAKAQKLYVFVQHLLLPDISFQLGPYDWRDFQQPAIVDTRVDFLFLLRIDHESTILPPVTKAPDDDDDTQGRTELNETEKKDFLLDAVSLAFQDSEHPMSSFRIVDWPDRLLLFHSVDPYFTDTAIQLLSLGRVLICDRLHAAILAFLSGIPFVYIDQTTGKISKSLRVALDAAGNGCNKSSSSMESLWFSSANDLKDAVTKGLHLVQLLPP